MGVMTALCVALFFVVRHQYLTQKANAPEPVTGVETYAAASGDYQSALAAFQTGLGLSDYAFEQELRFNEIVAYEKMGDFITAKDKCAEYVEAYPGDEEGEREYR